MTNALQTLLLFLLLAGLGASLAGAQTPAPSTSALEERVSQLERKVVELQRTVAELRRTVTNAAARRSNSPISTDTGGAAFLFGAFCALWAQNSGRSAWLWFFLGLFFSVITVIFLLVKNSNDRFAKRQRERFNAGGA